MSERAEDILRGIFGFYEFRPGQAEIIAHFAGRHAGRHVLAVMPTGGFGAARTCTSDTCFTSPATTYRC